MKISVITPSFNSGKTIERAIESVVAQDCSDVEHIIVDGRSTDETLTVLKRYPHLKWISEPDRGQVHAMNKGFAMATGDIIGYLNADDHYLPGAFSAVIPFFEIGEKMVMGRVLVRSQKPEGISEWICDARTDFPSVLRHWQADAFCVNPVGYFYLREVQENIPLQESTGAKHDLEFLIEASRRFSIRKINVELGIFNHAADTQTGREQLMPSYWQPEKFPFVNKSAAHLTAAERQRFYLERDRGYQLRRHWTVKDALAAGLAVELFEKEELFLLPEGEGGCYASSCGFVEHDRIGTRGDWIIPVLTMGKVGSTSVVHTLQSLPKNILPSEVYHVHQLPINISVSEPFPAGSHIPVGFALKKLFDSHGNNFQWKFITGVRDPIAAALSEFFENVWNENLTIDAVMDSILKSIGPGYFVRYFDEFIKDTIHLNVYDHRFDWQKKYAIIEKNNISILIYRMEDLSQIFSDAMEEYLGIPGLKIKSVNVGDEKPYKELYRQVKTRIRFEKSFLENIYASKYMKHFYSVAERESFLMRWSTGQTSKNLSGEKRSWK